MYVVPREGGAAARAHWLLLPGSGEGLKGRNAALVKNMGAAEQCHRGHAAALLPLQRLQADSAVHLPPSCSPLQDRKPAQGQDWSWICKKEAQSSLGYTFDCTVAEFLLLDQHGCSVHV